MRWGLKPLLVAGLFCHWVSQGHAEQISVCMEHWYPYYDLDEQGAPHGAAVEALDLALKEAGHTASYQILPYARCLQSVRLGRIDAVLTVSPGEAGLVHVGVPLAYWMVAAVVNESDPIDRFESLDQFDDYTPIYFNSYTYPGILADFVARPGGIGIPSQEDVLQPLRILQSRKKHVSFEDMLWAQRVVRAENLGVKVLEPAIVSEPNYLAFSPGLARLATSVDDILRRMRDDGTLSAIYARYLGDAATEGVEGS